MDLVLLQENRVNIGDSSTKDNLYTSKWGFVEKPGCTMSTESEHPRGGVAIVIKLILIHYGTGSVA